MLAKLTEQIERIALRTSPPTAARLIGAVPVPLFDALQRARFRRTLRLAAQHSAFYREQFRQRRLNSLATSRPPQTGVLSPTV